MAEHDSTFIINDVVLQIPPEQIKVNKTNALKTLKSIRTRSSQKVKSGKANATISLDVTFVDTDTINNDLRRLIAQFALTPFCYVENQYVQDAILGEEAGDRSMALALQNLVINTVPGAPGTLNAQFHFVWFNYKPFTPNFHFKNIPFTPLSQKRPGFAFQLFYFPQLSRHETVELQGSSLNMSMLEFMLAPDLTLGAGGEEFSLDINKPKLEDFQKLLEEFGHITNILDRRDTDAFTQNTEAYSLLADANIALSGTG